MTTVQINYPLTSDDARTLINAAIAVLYDPELSHDQKEDIGDGLDNESIRMAICERANSITPTDVKTTNRLNKVFRKAYSFVEDVMEASIPQYVVKWREEGILHKATMILGISLSDAMEFSVASQMKTA